MREIFDIEFLSHETADAFLISVGGPSTATHILVDGGLVKDVHGLISRIMKHKLSGKHLDLVVVTHVDNDHIGGILTLFRNSLVDCDFVKEVWFNGKIEVPVEPGSDPLDVTYAQGNKLSRLLQDKSITVREINCDTVPNGYSDNNCTVTVLAPSGAAVEALRTGWKSAEKLDIANETADHNVAWDELAKETFVEDDSVKNRSSIVILVESKNTNKRALFSGDSVPSEVMKSISEPIDVDLFKMPHHGSKANTNFDLIKHIRARRYIITAGAKSKKPHKKTLHTVVENAKSGHELYVPKGNWSVNALTTFLGEKGCTVLEYSCGTILSI